jgi:hypothetical protein
MLFDCSGCWLLPEIETNHDNTWYYMMKPNQWDGVKRTLRFSELCNFRLVSVERAWPSHASWGAENLQYRQPVKCIQDIWMWLKIGYTLYTLEIYEGWFRHTLFVDGKYDTPWNSQEHDLPMSCGSSPCQIKCLGRFGSQKFHERHLYVFFWLNDAKRGYPWTTQYVGV